MQEAEYGGESVGGWEFKIPRANHWETPLNLNSRSHATTVEV